jgi:hypothetical protein
LFMMKTTAQHHIFRLIPVRAFSLKTIYLWERLDDSSVSSSIDYPIDYLGVCPLFVSLA